MRKLLRRLSYLWNRRQAERDLAEEMSAHREQLEPHRAAAFGPSLRLREESRDVWGFLWLDQLSQDLRYGFRTLARAPRFVVCAVLILTLGVGINLAALHLYNAQAFHRYAIRDADSLLRFTRLAQSGRPASFSFPAIAFYRENAKLLSYVIGESRGVDLNVDDEIKPARVTFVSPSYFADLALAPVKGRLLGSQDADPGAPAAAVLGHHYWETRFAGDPDVLDRVIRINNKPVRIAGVAPVDFNGLPDGFFGYTDVWMLETTKASDDFSARFGVMFGKPKPGVGLAAAEEELRALTNSLREQRPDEFREGERPRGGALYSRGVRFEADVAVLLTLVFLILLSASANLGNILLARGLARQKEIGMRVALGASRWRVVRQLLTESLILGVLGAAGGMTAGYFGGKRMLSVMAAPPGLHVVMDWRMVITGIVVALFTVVAFGLPPAWQAVRKGPRVTRAKSILVAVQVAASCVLLIVSSMLTRGATRLENLQLRFDDRHTLTVNSRLGAARLAPELARQTSAEIESRLEGLPGVDAVAAFTRRNRHSEPSGQAVYWSEVGPAYFRVMNLPVLRGQAFSAREKDAAVVSESLARAMWPGQDPVGQILESQGVKRTVVGVVADSGLEELDPGSGEAYAPMSSTSLAEMFLVHTPADLRMIAVPVRLAAAVPGVAPYVASLWDSLDLHGATGQDATLVRMLGATATALAFLGIFGLVTFAIAQRTGELALRIALGARPLHILHAIARPYTFALGAGACVGAGLAAATGQILREQLHGLPPLDPLSFMAGVGMLGVVAVAAILSPARRAFRINPAAALRSE